MKSVVFFALLSAFWLPLHAQDTCVYRHLIPQKADFATADHLGNTYILRGFELEKYDSTGQFVTRFSTNRLGAPTYVDASNPMKLLVWYSSFQTVLFLDRNLIELGRLNLVQAGFPALCCLAAAADGNFWAYDERTAQMLKLNNAGIRLLESPPLNLELGRSLTPACIRDNSGQGPWMSDPALGVVVFDPFLRISTILPHKNLSTFTAQEDMLSFLTSDGIQFEPLRGMAARSVTFPASLKAKAGEIWLAPGKVLALTEHGVEVWTVDGFR
jgi:hypothetical protein